MSTYVELHARSAFSFLEAASSPERLAEQAARLGYPALALIDADGVYGAPRFYRAATALGLRPLVGAELTLPDSARLPLLVETAEGYRRLCRLLTRVKARAPKGQARASLDDLEGETRGLICLTGGADGPVAADLAAGRREAARATLARLVTLFGRGQVYVELQRHLTRESERRTRRLGELAETLRLPCVATNGVRYATPTERPVLDVLTAVRLKTPLDVAGRRLEPNAERWLKPAAEMARLFADAPAAVAETAELAARCVFTLKNLGYRFPDFPVPDEGSPIGYLRGLTEAGARERYRPVTERVRRQLARELDLIERLDLAGYFLIVWDIVRECRARGILCQGRGSAANSAVCYSLGITAVDPIGMDLLFERFLSEERHEWPDIDLDLPSGERREAIIQYVYARYGGTSAAMTANVITYQPRRAAREVGKALGFPPDLLDHLAKFIPDWGYRDPADGPARHLARAGLDPAHPRIRGFAELWAAVQGLPRHLGQHSGGMVLCAGRLDEVVPLEPATMPGRVVVQWDKDDCADLGLVKVDLLGLGMMAVLEDALGLCREAGHEVDLAHLPPNDPAVYAALQAADTVGLFQVESRAQMATLPRLRPACFYDLVVEVGIIRPGPIVGNMVHPYLARRAGREPVTYPHPSLEPILRRTLGVPLFQEQLLRMAMVAADFTGGEAEELRRALGFRRSEARMRAVEAKLRAGIARKGITGAAAEEIVRAITAFAEYGFPECVVGETRVIDADTGRWVPIADIVEGRAHLERTLACGPDMKIGPRRVRRATPSGRGMVYRVRTALGREVVATAEHPLLTIDGWRPLAALRAGDHIAAARVLPPLGRKRWPRHWLIALANLVAEGNLCHPRTFYFYTTDPRYRDEFVRAVERFGNTQATVARHRSCFSVHVRRREASRPVGAVEWAKRLGIWGCAARQKQLPGEVFELRTADVALLLARLWEGDGSLSRAGHVAYDTASHRLAEDVQHLLLRLGIISRVYKRTRPYRDRLVTGFVVTVTGRENLRRFARRVARRFLDAQKRAMTVAVSDAWGEGRSSRDVVPLPVRAVLDRERRRRGVTWTEVARSAGISARAVCSPNGSKRGYRRWLIARLARYFDSTELANLAESDLCWDRIVAIDPIGVRATYDLQVEGDHNFFANDLVVHNSHAASFALLAYASAYLKVHHPAQFTAGILNNQPMGFYHPATLVKDAQRHGVTVRPVDVARSEWRSTVEDGAVRLGLMTVRGLREAAGRRLVEGRGARSFDSVDDLVARAGLTREEVVTLAEAGALGAFGLTRRAAIWAAERAARPPGPLWLGQASPPEPSPLREMTVAERLVADYRSAGLTVGPHPMALRRKELARRGVIPAAGLSAVPDGRRVTIAGSVIVRQRPGTAKGFVFLSLEDETGIANAIVRPPLFERDRAAIVHAPFLLVEGILQHQDGVTAVRATAVRPLVPFAARVPSHDFH